MPSILISYLSPPFISAAMVMASSVFSWPSGGMRQMAPKSFTASCDAILQWTYAFKRCTTDGKF